MAGDFEGEGDDGDCKGEGRPVALVARDDEVDAGLRGVNLAIRDLPSSDPYIVVCIGKQYLEEPGGGVVCYSPTQYLCLGNTNGQHACLWSQENPNAQIIIYGLLQLRAFYLPWVMLMIFGSPLMPGLEGIMVEHLYYFFSVLHPLATGKNYLKTLKWVHKIVARFRIGMQANAPVRAPANVNARTGAFSGRSYRLDQ